MSLVSNCGRVTGEQATYNLTLPVTQSLLVPLAYNPRGGKRARDLHTLTNHHAALGQQPAAIRSKDMISTRKTHAAT